MTAKLLTENYLKFLSLTAACTGSYKSIHIKMSHCWKSHVVAHINTLLQKDKYAQVFKDNGYDNTMLISGMTEKELKDIGIKTKGTKQKLLQDIQLLPNYEIIAEVPVSTLQICLTICMLLLGIFIPAHRILLSEI